MANERLKTEKVA